MTEFQGFPTDLVPFLMELTAHNDRDWFKANEKRYEASLRQPALAFIRAMAEPLATVTRHLVTDDRKVGGSLMRIQRDTRFAKDKSPYKNNVGIQFRHVVGKDIHAPGVYLHIAADEAFLGIGLWQPPPDVLQRLREAVAEKWDRWSAILSAPPLATDWKQHGDSLKRVPRGFDAAHPGVEELKRTSFIAMLPVPIERLEAPDAPERIIGHVRHGRDYMAFLCEALGLPF